MTASPVIIEGTNLSDVYLQTLEAAIKVSGHEFTPFLLNLKGFDESIDFKEKLDAHLLKSGNTAIDTVAETIFPQSLYQYCKYDRKVLYKTYKRNLPRIKAINRYNRKGTYFQRLIDFEVDGGEPVNQLEIIIKSILDGNVKRRSKLQASVFDPTKDHIPDAYQKFPCMQHIAFHKTGKELRLTSFYALQHLYEKAYGNWLGLINLGKFVAKETNLQFVRLDLYAGSEKLEVAPKLVRNLL